MSTMGNLPELDIDRIKTYNAELKKYTDKAANLKAEQTFIKNDVEKLCAELSAELGMQITPDNIEQVYMERVAKIENTLRTGEEILGRIKAEEGGQVAQTTPAAYDSFAPINQHPATQQSPVQHVPVQQAPVQQPMQDPVGAPAYAPVQNTGYAPPSDPTQAPVNPSAQPQGQGSPFASLPNMFGNGSVNI